MSTTKHRTVVPTVRFSGYILDIHPWCVDVWRASFIVEENSDFRPTSRVNAHVAWRFGIWPRGWTPMCHSISSSRYKVGIAANRGVLHPAGQFHHPDRRFTTPCRNSSICTTHFRLTLHQPPPPVPKLPGWVSPSSLSGWLSHYQHAAVLGHSPGDPKR